VTVETGGGNDVKFHSTGFVASPTISSETNT
ncbi:uncharacterized protein METZ01_LOCUS119686, partial [marine metagenome]